MHSNVLLFFIYYFDKASYVHLFGQNTVKYIVKYITI